MAALHDTGPGAGLLLKTLRFSPVVGEVAEGLEAPIQLIYLATLLGFLVVGAYLVVRQVRLTVTQFPSLVVVFEYSCPWPAQQAIAAVCGNQTSDLDLQVLIRRELEEAAKTLGERARQSDATSEVLPAIHGLEDLS